MNLSSWKVKDFVLFFVMVTVAVLVVKYIGSKITVVGKITEKM